MSGFRIAVAPVFYHLQPLSLLRDAVKSIVDYCSRFPQALCRQLDQQYLLIGLDCHW